HPRRLAMQDPRRHRCAIDSPDRREDHVGPTDIEIECEQHCQNAEEHERRYEKSVDGVRAITLAKCGWFRPDRGQRVTPALPCALLSRTPARYRTITRDCPRRTPAERRRQARGNRSPDSSA